MTSTRSRIGLLAGFFVAGLGIVLAHLWGVMVVNHEVWAARSHENRWAFRSVPSVRGAIRDRTGELIAHDEPTTELSLYYQRFRLRHAVGAAVHGAMAWARLQPGGEGTTYSYLDGVLGPEAAARDLMAMPTLALRPGRYPKDVTAELRTLATTVLSACSGLPRKRVSAAMRMAALSGGTLAIGDCLPGITLARVLDNYQNVLEALREFDRELIAERRDRQLRLGQAPDERSILFRELEYRREQSIAQERVVKERKADGSVVLGELKETIAWPFADHVPFELAASLRVGARVHPGLEVNPSVQRIQVDPEGSSLRSLLGQVFDVDRVDKSDAWVERYVHREMPDDWLDELVPADAAPNAEERKTMQDEAEASFARALLLQARGGISGIERGFEDSLSGRHGIRLVERDARRREQQLWSSLEVQSGTDLNVTLDLGLQRLAETAVRQAQAETARLHRDPEDQDRCRAGLAVIDALTGDILAMVGAPVSGPDPGNVPGVTWPGDGSIGSVVKPFILLEHLQAEAVGRPHRASFTACGLNYDYRGHTLHCEAHGQEGCDPVRALAKSCNSFFYQCAEGLGEDGVARAMRRVGLLKPTGPADPFTACWQEKLAGLPVVRPVWTGKPYLPRRAIGYEVQASPLSVARAYAALATGRLPTLGLVLGEVRPSVPLDDLALELEVVREGLRECVTSGTARKVEALATFQVLGKTGTAEVGAGDKENNAWFAGYLPWSGRSGVQLCFCAVVYWVPNGEHGGEVAGGLVADLLTAIQGDADLQARYLLPGGGR